MRPSLESYPHLAGGKVRELYAVDDEHLLLVATDRISAFDHVLSTPIPDKGRVLTAMSFFYFDLLGGNNHLAGPPDDPRIPDAVLGRAMVVRRLAMIPVECVVRGYLTGSGLTEYRRSGSVCGIDLPAGLVESAKLDDPIFTPTTKAPVGAHDAAMEFAAVSDLLGPELAFRLREDSIDLYFRAAAYAEQRGVILADTKFEFGRDESGELVLADEVLTPDSSRYWPAAEYTPGTVQSSFDKQYVRNWLTGPDSGWDRDSGTPPPALPDAVVAATRARYIDAYERISDRRFADWARPAATGLG
ncbi:phosphoribosylaminoimidazolesuccinocarboxamide synthase [Skermania piniformis]|uniref:Phosphoribosylaminoimidazole-succinocarboxamide synthase n=1 Tax=Skermania pinensis TaxID=39122 RepID=A0ABX8S915_9ACTN|nr:phosphoribosylaminoimidazolesuccinocarboxamide synthase [Skermania piniformis]QXQ13487.1 phosphoribosylaminoimidazolesuccinocarboxamide synthase [Skermania piniformis]